MRPVGAGVAVEHDGQRERQQGIRGRRGQVHDRRVFEGRHGSTPKIHTIMRVIVNLKS